MADTIIVGAHLRLYVNTRPFGRVQRFVFRSDNPQTVVQGIDTLETLSLEDGQIQVSGEMTIYRQHLDGGVEAAGLVPTATDAARGKYFSFLLLDRLTDSPIFQVDKAKVVSQEWTAVAAGEFIGRVAWRAITWANEVPSSTL